MIQVRVRLFAGLRERVGASEVLLELPGGTDVAEVLARLAADFPKAALSQQQFAVAVNRSFAKHDRLLVDGDEVALIPPVSGGVTKLFEIVEGPISLDDVARRVLAPERGGVTVFAGTVRGITGVQQTDYLEYEAYPEMAEASFAAIAGEAQARWPDISAVAVVHRVGRLEVGDVSIAIAVAAAHRSNTFESCQYIIDRIKQISPIWKKEFGPKGSEWVEGPESHVGGDN
jgi:molybdopterin converting factor subunit 1